MGLGKYPAYNYQVALLDAPILGKHRWKPRSEIMSPKAPSFEPSAINDTDSITGALESYIDQATNGSAHRMNPALRYDRVDHSLFSDRDRPTECSIILVPSILPTEATCESCWTPSINLPKIST